MKRLNKVVSISACVQCPFCNKEYWAYEDTCTQLNRALNGIDIGKEIPDYCPLEDAPVEELECSTG